MYTWASCSGESRNRSTCLQTADFELLDCTAIKLKRPKVCKQKSLNTINIYRKQQQTNSAPLSTGKVRVVLAVGELERVPALTVTSPVRCSLIIPDHERRALFLLSSHQFGNL